MQNQFWYECLEYKNDNYIKIINDKIYKHPYDRGLNYGCLESENLVTFENHSYSCIKCKDNFTLANINSTSEIKTCYEKQNIFLIA